MKLIPTRAAEGPGPQTDPHNGVRASVAEARHTLSPQLFTVSLAFLKSRKSPAATLSRLAAWAGPGLPLRAARGAARCGPGPSPAWAPWEDPAPCPPGGHGGRGGGMQGSGRTCHTCASPQHRRPGRGGGAAPQTHGPCIPGGWVPRAPRLLTSEALALLLPDPRGSGQGASAWPRSPAAQGTVGLWGLFCISRRFRPARLCLQSPGHWQGFPRRVHKVGRPPRLVSPTSSAVGGARPLCGNPPAARGPTGGLR